MANLQNTTIPNGGTIGSTSVPGAITIDSSGNIQLASSLTAGTLGALVNHKIYTHTHTSESGYQTDDPYNFGTSLVISSTDNTAGAKFLILASGGRTYATTSVNGGQKLVYKEGSDFTTGTEGTEINHLAVPYTDQSEWESSGTIIGTYTNSGSATNLYIRTAIFSGSAAMRWYGGDGGIGIIAIRIS